MPWPVRTRERSDVFTRPSKLTPETRIRRNRTDGYSLSDIAIVEHNRDLHVGTRARREAIDVAQQVGLHASVVAAEHLGEALRAAGHGIKLPRWSANP
jgi:hypothetical protein